MGKIFLLTSIYKITLFLMLFIQCSGDNEDNASSTAKWSYQLKINASNAQDGDYFGYSVSISGDYAIAGAPLEDGSGPNGGAAYIFHRTGINRWDAGTKIFASDFADGDCFGNSVSISGDYAIVGAYLEDGSGSDRGAAYIFQRTGTNTWSAGTKIIAIDPENGDVFGYSVSISGDYAIVGAPNYDGGRGAAYTFQRNGTNSWSAGTRIIASDPAANDEFGCSVSISGDLAIAGARFEDDSGANGNGAAYIFQRIGNNSWGEVKKIFAPDPTANDEFGSSVSISGDFAIVGAPNVDGGGAFKGAAYIFLETAPQTWDAGTRIIASDMQDDDKFGFSVSISGDYAIVGALEEDGSGINKGAAYVFQRTGTNIWSTGIKIIASDAADNDFFGISVSMSGDYAIAGACNEDGSGTDRGAVYIFK
jgi:hypothetical protein